MKKAIRVYTLATLVVLALLTALAVYQLTGGRTERSARGASTASVS